MRAIIDPQFIALHVGQHGDIEGRVQDVLSTYRDVRDQKLLLLSSDELFAVLSISGVYPLRATYEDLLADAGIIHTNGTDLARVVLRLIQESTVLEDLVADSQLGGCRCRIEESLKPGCDCHPELNNAVESSLHAYAASSIIDDRGETAFLLTQRRRDPSTTLNSDIEFVGVLSHKEEMFEEIGIHLDLSTAPSLEEFFRTVDPQALMRRAHRDESLVTIAIHAAAAQVSGGAVPKWSMSEHFTADVIASGISRTAAATSKFLRACVETLLDEAMGDTHWLRTSEGGNASQVVRDGASAWRRDVDRDLHIHYWILADGSKQLAAIVHHNNFSIPNPDIGTR